MAWAKSTVDADKIVSLDGQKYLITSLTGRKGGEENLTGSADKSKTLLGDTLINFTVDADKLISLLGGVGVSLEGAKYIATLLGELATTVQLLGEFPYSYYQVTVDTTYITVDYTDITVDRNLS